MINFGSKLDDWVKNRSKSICLGNSWENILSESLNDTFQRVVPYYKKRIEPLIVNNKNVLIVFHGNSCRALLMKIFNISKEKIIEFEIPTGNPLLIRFEKKLNIKDYKYLDNTRAKKILFDV